VPGLDAGEPESLGDRVVASATTDGECPGRGGDAPALVAHALFGRDVLDEDSGEILDADLSTHGYQLWTAAVGTVIEAQRRDLPRAVLVVHQFRPRDLDAAAEQGDKRDWATALNENAAAFAAFAKALEASGATSLETEFVKAGTKLDLLKVESYVDV
jgi:hypothetical protein